MMPVILLAGIYGGATTPTEAAAIAAFYALLLAMAYRALSASSLYDVFFESARSSGPIGLVIGGSTDLQLHRRLGKHSHPVAVLFSQFDLSPLEFLFLVNLLLLALGCLLDATTIILVIIPLLVPTCRALGIDLVHFGVVAVVNCMIGLITPPYGMLLFVINGATGIPIKDIVRESVPYLFSLLVSLLLLILFPELVLWLPRKFGYQG